TKILEVTLRDVPHHLDLFRWRVIVEITNIHGPIMPVHGALEMPRGITRPTSETFSSKKGKVAGLTGVAQQCEDVG
ncbi:hypothetical protein, partial [Klebsiella pneumoniae]|uniref:hypothetical protein n=1 Tax=Klebsiella pneumoniae TaxID=573 RepID=UPI001D0F23E2